MKTMINNQIHLFKIAGDKEEVWKMIRIIVFFDIAGRSTAPKELFSAVDLSYYEVIIRPLLRIIIGDTEETKMLRKANVKAFKVWLTVKENHSANVKKAIVDTIDRRKWPSIEKWDEIKYTKNHDRLLRNRKNYYGLGRKLTQIMIPKMHQPSVLIYNPFP